MGSIQECERTAQGSSSSCLLGIRKPIWTSFLQCQRGRYGLNLRTQFSALQPKPQFPA